MTSSTITIDGIAYNLNDLSEGVKGSIATIRLVDKKIADLQNDLAILRTARMTYARAINSELKKDA